MTRNTDSTQSLDAEETGITLIASERQRQVNEEGWTPSHDDGHSDGALARAAACYAIGTKELRRPIAVQQRGENWSAHGTNYINAWPFEEDDWKPTPHDRIRELQKAGALIAAEIDRLKRVPSSQPVVNNPPKDKTIPAEGEISEIAKEIRRVKLAFGTLDNRALALEELAQRIERLASFSTTGEAGHSAPKAKPSELVNTEKEKGA